MFLKEDKIKLEEILAVLKPHSTVLSITKSALFGLKKIDYSNFHTFILNSVNLNENSISRPFCPVLNSKYYSRARFPYKNAMNEYIGQWGYKFENPLFICPSILEATANYLENHKLSKEFKH